MLLLYTCIHVQVCTCINVYMYQYVYVSTYSYIHGYTYTFFTSLPLYFLSDFLDFAILGLISVNALFHNVFHKGTNSKTFLVGNGLHLANKFC